MILINFMDAVFAVLVGGLLGLFYFVGLWLTVRQLGRARRVALLFFGSMVLRTSVVMLGFYFMLGDNWQQLLVGLLGFMLVRLLATRWLRPTEPPRANDQSVGYAP